LVDFLEAHEVPSGLDHSLQLRGAHASVVVEIERVEGLVAVEAGSGGQSVSDGLSRVLDSEVGSPHVLELEGGVGEEAVVSPNGSGSVVGGSAVDHAAVVRVVGQEGVRELVEVQASVSGLVVPSHEKIDLLAGGEHVDGVQAGSDLVAVDLSVVGDVKDVEGVSQVEVVLLGQVNLGGFKLHLLVAEVLEAVHQLVLVVNSEDGLSGGRRSGRAHRGSHGR